MKRLSTILIFLFTVISFAQQSFFETIAAHGKNAKYLNFGEIYNNDDGKQQTSNGEPQSYSVELFDYEALPSGIIVNYLYDDKNKKPLLRRNYNIAKEQVIEFVGYPNTSMVYHGGYNRAYVAIGNYIFFLKGVSKDKLDFNQIAEAIVVKGTKAQSSSADKTKKKKKKGFGKFLGKLKDAAVSGNKDPRYSQPSGPEYNALMAQDVKQMIKDYLVKMKAKQNAYKMTAKDKADLATLKNAAKEYDEYVRQKNAAFWNSPEGQAVLRNRENVKLAEKRHMKFCRLTKELCGQVIHPSY